MRRIIVPVMLVAGIAWADTSALTKLLAKTDKVAREVSKIRGLPLKKPIPNEVVDKDELRARLIAMAAEDKTAAETAADGIALARWGMIPLGLDYKKLLVDLLTEQIAGYYDPETKKLTISKSAGDDANWAEMVLAHEIDHGLQDQSFDLKAFEDLPENEGDAATARRALVEGDGIALMVEVILARSGNASPWSNPQVADVLVKGMATPGAGDGLDNAPLVVRESMLFPYRAGLSFVAALRRRSPWSAVDAAFAKPPKSTEHILHPERYLAGDEPVPVVIRAPAALKGYAPAQDTVWGELGWDLFLRSHGIDEGTAANAAAGWGGDRVVTYARTDDKRPERAVGLSRSEWDSEADALEAFEAAEKAIDDTNTGTLIDKVGWRTRWLALDGTISWIERKDASLVMAVGVPAWAADALVTEAWQVTGVGPPVAALGKAKPNASGKTGAGAKPGPRKKR